MPRFNFNEITLSSKADITKIMENFTKIENNARTADEISTMIGNTAAPIAHDSTADTYGVGTLDKYGHCKTIDDLTKETFVNGEALAAHQGKVLDNKITTLDTSLGGLAKKTYSTGTAAPTSSTDGDIYDQYFE